MQKLCCPICRKPFLRIWVGTEAAGTRFLLRCKYRQCSGRPWIVCEVQRDGRVLVKAIDKAPVAVVA